MCFIWECDVKCVFDMLPNGIMTHMKIWFEMSINEAWTWYVIHEAWNDDMRKNVYVNDSCETFCYGNDMKWLVPQ
mgnify:CR=1 FL=1